MKTNTTSRITAFAAALAVLCSSAASCGKAKEKKPKTADQLLSNSYRAEKLEAPEELGSITGMSLTDGGEKVLITAFDYSSSAPQFYVTDKEFSDFTELETDIKYDGNVSASFYTGISPEGNIFVIAAVDDYGDFELPDYEDPDFDYENFNYEAMEEARVTSYEFYLISSEGETLKHSELKNADKYIAEGDRLYVSSITPYSEDGALVITNGETSSLFVVNSDGEVTEELDSSNYSWVEGASVSASGDLAISGYSTTKGEYISFYSADDLSPKGDGIAMESTNINGIDCILTGTDDYELLASCSSALYGLKADGTAEEIINWLDSDLGSGYVDSLIPLGNDEYLVCYSSYNSAGSEFYKMTKRDTAELADTQVITLAVMYDDWTLNSKINDFNNSNDKYRIKTVNYEQYYDYDEDSEKLNNSAEQQLKMDIVSGNEPDMILTYDRTIITSLANKGLYEDLYTYLEKDPDLSKDDLMPNVLRATETGGKLYSLSPSFNVITFMAKSKFLDGRESWTLDDLIDVYNDLPDGMSLYTQDTRETILSLLMYIAKSLVDYETGTCSFDSPEFTKLLEFAAQFPSEEDIIDWETATDDEINDYYDSLEDMILNDKALLSEIYFYDSLREYAREAQGKFGGEDVTLIGAPCEDGNGGTMTLDRSFAILSSSPNKDVCWDFIKQFFTEDSYDEMTYGLPTLKSQFDKMAEESMEKPYYTDEETGKKVEYDDTYYIGEKEIKVKPLTKEEKDYLVDYIMNVDVVGADYSQDVEEIISEETQAFFKGEKTAEETADMIQNRVSILVSEQA